MASPTVTKKGTACVQHIVNSVHSMKYIFIVLSFRHAMFRLVVMDVMHLVLPLSTKYCKHSLIIFIVLFEMS